MKFLVANSLSALGKGKVEGILPFNLVMRTLVAVQLKCLLNW